MKLTTGIVALALTAGTAWAQNSAATSGLGSGVSGIAGSGRASSVTIRPAGSSRIAASRASIIARKIMLEK